jgi:FkbM family methyltransferase
MSLKSKVQTFTKISAEKGLGDALLTAGSRLLHPFAPDEPALVLGAFAKLSQPGIMLDVWAHHGTSLLPFARAGWQVYAFEPDPQNRAVLEANTADLTNVHIDPRALSDHSEQGAAFFQSSQSSGVSSLKSFLPSHQASASVDVTTLENILDEIAMPAQAVDFLKVDTEGYDLMVLQGWPWAAGQPRLILCEFDDFKTKPLGYDFLALAQFLAGKGYSLLISEWYPIEKYGVQHSWRRFAEYPCWLKSPRAWGNIFAVQEQALYQALVQECKAQHPF